MKLYCVRSTSFECGRVASRAQEKVGEVLVLRDVERNRSERIDDLLKCRGSNGARIIPNFNGHVDDRRNDAETAEYVAERSELLQIGMRLGFSRSSVLPPGFSPREAEPASFWQAVPWGFPRRDAMAAVLFQYGSFAEVELRLQDLVPGPDASRRRELATTTSWAGAGAPLALSTAASRSDDAAVSAQRYRLVRDI